jgi:uncharacterized coiled-coil protein SlyX
MEPPMTSERKTATNRSNSRSSCGPRSAAGKNKVSRNAMRHGLAALVHRQPAPSAEMDQLTNAICGSEQDPLLRKQAATIAETALVLRAVQAQKSALIERLRDRETVALASGDNRLIHAQARHLQSERTIEHLSALCARVLERNKDRLRPAVKGDAIQPNGCLIGDFVPLQIKLLDEYAEADESMLEAYETRSSRLDQAGKLLKERNERQAVIEALPDLVRLDRYERRAWSRQKRAIRNYIRIQVEVRSKTGVTGDPSGAEV